MPRPLSLSRRFSFDDYSPPLVQLGKSRSPTDEKTNGSANRSISAPTSPRAASSQPGLSLRAAVLEIAQESSPRAHSQTPTPLRSPTPTRTAHSPVPPFTLPRTEEFAIDLLDQDPPPVGSGLASSPEGSPRLITEELLQTGDLRPVSPQESDGPPLRAVDRRFQVLDEDEHKAPTRSAAREWDAAAAEVEEKERDSEDVHEENSEPEFSLDRNELQALASACREKQKNYNSVVNRLVVVAKLVATVFATIYLCPVGGALGYGLGTVTGLMGLFSAFEGKRVRFLAQLSAVSLVIQREIINKSILTSFAPGFSSAVMIDGFGDIAKNALKTSFYKEVIQALNTDKFVEFLEKETTLYSRPLPINLVFAQYSRFKWLEERENNKSLATISRTASHVDIDSAEALSGLSRAMITERCNRKENKPSKALLKGTLKVAAAACVGFSVGGGAAVLATFGAGYVALDVSRRIYNYVKGDPYKNASRALNSKEEFSKYVSHLLNNGHSLEFVKNHIVQIHKIYNNNF